MNWLKRLGMAVKVGAGLIPAYSSLITALILGDKDDRAVARIADTLEQVGGVIAQTEIFGAALNLPGKDKLTAAAPSVSQIILRSSLMVGKKVKDEKRFEAAVTGLASNVAEILSSVEED